MGSNFIEYLTSNEHIAYPFGEDALALVPIWADVDVTITKPTIPKDFLADAVILVPAEYAGYLYLHSITCVTLTEYEFDIRDEGGTTIIDFSVSIAAPAPPVHSIIQEVTAAAPSYAVRMLTGPSFVDYLTKIGADLGVGNTVSYGTRLSFETGAVEFRPERVSKLQFKDSVSDIVYALDEDVGVYEGFNLELTGGPSSLTMRAEPGIGLGRDDAACVGTPVPSWHDTITSLQGSIGDEDGNINLKGAPCHRIEPDPDNHRILIYNDCEPCCLCEDYGNVATALQSYFDRLDTIWQGDFLPYPGYTNFLTLVDTLNNHISLYNGSIFPNIRTFTFWGHIMVGSANYDRGSVQSSANATMSLVLVNRCPDLIDIHGIVAWSTHVVAVEKQIQGTDSGAIELSSFNIQIEPFSELHLYWLVRHYLGASLNGLNTTVTAYWTQNGVTRTLQRPIAE